VSLGDGRPWNKDEGKIIFKNVGEGPVITPILDPTKIAGTAGARAKPKFLPTAQPITAPDIRDSFFFQPLIGRQTWANPRIRARTLASRVAPGRPES